MQDYIVINMQFAGKYAMFYYRIGNIDITRYIICACCQSDTNVHETAVHQSTDEPERALTSPEPLPMAAPEAHDDSTHLAEVPYIYYLKLTALVLKEYYLRHIAYVCKLHDCCLITYGVKRFSCSLTPLWTTPPFL